MPIGLRNIEPVRLGAHSVELETDEHRKCVHLTVANNTIVGALLQLASLVRHADDLFCDVSDECQKVFDRTEKLTKRIVWIDETVAKLDAKRVLVPVGDLKQFSSVHNHHEARHGFNANLFVPLNRPQCIADQYNLCQSTPSNALRHADLYRQDGLCSSKLFKLWPIALNEPKVKTPDLNLPRKIQRIRSFEKKYKPLKIRERPKTIHGWDDFNLEDIKADQKDGTKDKGGRDLVSLEPPVVIPIDTSGSNFERMQSLRSSGRKVKEERDKGRERKKKRRRTVSGVPDQIMREISQFERKQRTNDKPRQTPRSYSFDDLDADDNDYERDEGIMKYLDEIDGKMEERLGEEKSLRIMKFFPCRRAKSLPRCVKLGSVSRALSAERRSQRDLNTSYTSSSLSLTSCASSRLSRSTKRSSMISQKLKILVTGGNSSKEKQRPKSLDLDTLLNEDEKKEDKEYSKSTHSLVHLKHSSSVPDHRGLNRNQSDKSRESVGPGTYYNFESSTLPRTQAKKYDFPWESLPKDWTTSVKLREISKRRAREDRQSSSGNWSGTSSNRQSLDSDNLRSSEGLPFHSQYSLGKDSGRDSLVLEEEQDGTDGTSTAGYAGDGTSTVVGSTDSVSVGNPKSDFTQQETQAWLQTLALRAAKRSDVSHKNADEISSLSRLTRQNIMALDLMMSEQPNSRKITDEESSTYSVDQEGFYTSFHNDSGLKKSTNTLVDEEVEEESCSQSKDTNSVCSVESVIFRPANSEKFANLRKGNSNQAKMLSKVTPPMPPQRTSSYKGEVILEGNESSASNSDSKLSPPQLHSFPSQDSSVSESDQEAVFTRVHNKTQISSTSYPSLVALSTSEDESSPDNRSDSFNNVTTRRRKGDDYIFNENDDVPSQGMDSSANLSYFSFDDGSFHDPSSFMDSAVPRDVSKGVVENTDQGYDTLTLPKSQRRQNEMDAQEGTYQSWPRSHKSSNQQAPGILKTPEKNGESSRPPKTLNFAPMVNLFNHGTPNSVQMPLPSPSNSSSSESNLTSLVNSSSLETAIDSRNSYKLSVPINGKESHRSRSRQSDKTATSNLPMKYQPVITVTPRSRSSEGQGHEMDNSGAYIKLTPDSNRPPAMHGMSNTSRPSASSTPHSSAAHQKQSQSLYAVSPVAAPKDSSRQSSNMSNSYQSQAQNNDRSNYLEMQSRVGIHKTHGSSNSIASSDSLHFTEDGSTYVSMSSPCSSPNLSNMDFSISNTPSGSMDSLLDLRRTPTNGLEPDTYQINTNLRHNSNDSGSATETVAIVTSAGNSGSNTGDQLNSTGNQTFSSFRSPDSSTSSSSSFRNRSNPQYTHQTSGRQSLDSTVTTDNDLTMVSQMSQSQLSNPGLAPTTQSQHRAGRQEPSYRTPTAHSTSRRSYPLETPTLSRVPKDSRSRSNSNTPQSQMVPSRSQESRSGTRSADSRSGQSRSNTDTRSKSRPQSSTANSNNAQRYSSHNGQSSMPSSKSLPSGLTNLQNSRNNSSSPGKLNQNGVGLHYQNSGRNRPVKPSTMYNPAPTESGISSRSDSYRVAVGESAIRTGSYRAANIHQSKSFPVLPSAKQSGPVQVALAMNPSKNVIPMNEEEPVNRADSYRMAVRRTNGIVDDVPNRNSSYRVAMNDIMPTAMNNRLNELSKSGPVSSVGGRDVRRMGITDVDQAKDISINSSSSSQSKHSNSHRSNSEQPFARIRKATKPDIDPIQVLSSMDYNRNDTHKSNKNNPNRSSTYLQFDPIFEDLEDFSNSTESLRMAMTASLKKPPSDTGSQSKGGKSLSKYSSMNGAGDRRDSSRSQQSGSKTTRKTKSGGNIEIEDDWRFSAV